MKLQKADQQIHFHFCGNGCLFMWGAYFHMSAYKCDVVVVFKMGAYIHGFSFSIGVDYLGLKGRG